MPEAPILPIDDPLLKMASMPITVIDEDVRALADRMFMLMDRANGAGLAAIPEDGERRARARPVREDRDHSRIRARRVLARSVHVIHRKAVI